MRKVIRESILAIIDKVIDAAAKRNTFMLNKLSNYTIHSASIFQDEDSLSIAIITYSLSKVLNNEKEIIPKSDKGVIKRMIDDLRKVKEHLFNKEYEKYRQITTKIFKCINRLDKKTGRYVDEVVRKSRIKKGTAMFEHGISLQRVAERMDLSLWELMDYVGNTLDDEKLKDTRISSRLRYARQIFNV